MKYNIEHVCSGTWLTAGPQQMLASITTVVVYYYFHYAKVPRQLQSYP